MVGIYKYENGLVFTGVVANTVADAEAYLGNKYGYREIEEFSHFENDCPVYTKRFVPRYNKNAFVIKSVEFINFE